MQTKEKKPNNSILKYVLMYGLPSVLFLILGLYIFQEIFKLQLDRYVISYFLNDPLLNMSILKHNMDIFLSHNISELWNMHIFYPYKQTLAFSENLFLQSIMLLPLYEITGHNIAVTYNLAIIIGFICIGFFSYVTFYYYSKDIEAALLGSIFFTFSPFYLTHVNHFQVITSIWLPLVFLTLHISFEKKDIKYTILSSIFYVTQSISCMYYMVIIPMFILISFLIYYNAEKHRFYLKYLLVFILFSALPIALIATPYLRVFSLYGLKRTIEDVAFNSPNFFNFILPTPCSILDGILRSILKHIPSYASIRLYLGFIPTMITLYALIVVEKNILLSIKFINKSTKAEQNDYIPVVSLRKFNYPPVIKFFWWSFWLSLILTTGPTVLGSPIPNPIYIIFFKLYPGGSAIRAPMRFYVITVFSVGFFISYFYSIYFKNRKRHTLFFILTLIVLVDFLPKNTPVRKLPYNGEVPEVYKWIKNNTSVNDKIMEFPIYELYYIIDSIHCTANPDSMMEKNGFFYTFFTAFHKRTIFNGYSGYTPPLYLYTLVSDPHTQIEIAKSIGIKYLVIHKDLYTYIEQTAKNKLQNDLKQLIDFQNHRQELLFQIKMARGHKVYEDSLAEIYELKNNSHIFKPEEANLSSCRTSISAKLDGNTLKIRVLNSGTKPCLLLYKERLRVEIAKDRKTVKQKKIVLIPGQIPPFLPVDSSFIVNVKFPHTFTGYPVKVSVYAKTQSKTWKKIGTCILKQHIQEK